MMVLEYRDVSTTMIYIHVLNRGGVDVIETGADGIKTVRGYFDTRAVPDQLGLQVLVQPFQIGPFSFGNSVSVQSGKKTKPGAFGIATMKMTRVRVEAQPIPGPGS